MYTRISKPTTLLNLHRRYHTHTFQQSQKPQPALFLKSYPRTFHPWYCRWAYHYRFRRLIAVAGIWSGNYKSGVPMWPSAAAAAAGEKWRADRAPHLKNHLIQMSGCSCGNPLFSKKHQVRPDGSSGPSFLILMVYTFPLIRQGDVDGLFSRIRERFVLPISPNPTLAFTSFFA